MKSVTIHAACNPSDRRADGTIPVKLRIYYDGRSRHLPTTLTAGPGDLTRSGHLRPGTLASRAEALVAECRHSIAKLSPFTLEAWDVDAVVRWLRRDLGAADFRLDFLAWCEAYAAAKPPTARQHYTHALSALRRYLGDSAAAGLDINDVTSALAADFAAYVRATISDNAGNTYTSALRAMHNAAKERYNDEDTGVIVIPRSPFSRLRQVRVVHQGQHNLGREVMQRIISADTPYRAERFALDAFVLSFVLMGMNLADLRTAAPPCDGVLQYRRQKTAGRRADGALQRVLVPACAAPFVARLTRGARAGYWLAMSGRNCSTLTACINNALRRWAAREGLQPFTFYAARHSFASIARSLGVEKATIDECLVHTGSLALADVYIEKDWTLLWAAQQKVLDAFSW